MSEIVPYQHYQEIVSYGRSPEVMETFSRLVGRNAPHYVQSAIIAVQANDRLMQCSPKSIFRSALRAATLRLSCDPALGHAWLVPYKNKSGGLEAQFQAGWKGIQHMAIRTGKYRYINVAPVFEGEDVVEDRITGSLKFEGGVTSPKKEKGLIASFALLSGLQKSIYMTNEEMEEHGKRYSKGYNKADGIWMTNKPAAYHKTILLKLLRTYGYLDPSDAAILDDEQPEINDFELPDETEVTIVERKPISAAEANKYLGFEDVDQDGNVVTVIVEKPGILTQAAAPTEAAETITDGEVSVEITQEKQVVDEGPLTIEAACNVETSDNPARRYGDLSIAELSARFNELSKQLKVNHLEPAERAIKERKVKAAKMIIDAKRNGEF